MSSSSGESGSDGLSATHTSVPGPSAVNTDVKVELKVPRTGSILPTNDLKGSTLSQSEGVTYSWKNLNVYAQTKSFTGKIKSETHIIKDVSGLCKPGQFLAVMGASGAGKTTLLNVLTYRSMNLKITGDMVLNGHPVDTRTLMGVSAYVQQEDLFCKVFSVREQLEFHARLRIGKDVSREKREARVNEVIHELGLAKCQNTPIGDPGRVKGISGGEKKRLAFACEIITNPMLLFCDEPTSGLDAFMAQSVTEIMKKMATLGKTIISTIHQPSSEVFAMFDQLLLLSEGRVAFHGSVPEALDFFSRMGKPCPDDFNPSDHFIYTLAIKGGKEDECKEYVNNICDEFRDNEGVSKEKEIDETMVPPKEHDALKNLKLSTNPYRATYFNQFGAVFKRAGLEVARNKVLLGVKLGQTAFFALIFGLVYFDQDPETGDGIKNITSAMFLFVTNVSFANLFPVVTTFAAEMPLLLREHWNGMYKTSVYFWTRTFVELPVYILIPIIYNSVSYYMVGFRPEAHYFFIATLTYIMVTNVAVSYGYMISCLSKDYSTALTISTPLTIPLQLFGGFYIRTETIPVYLRWIQYLSWFAYGFEILSINQWEDFTIEYNVPEINGTQSFIEDRYLNYYQSPANNTGTYDVGDYVLDQLAMDVDQLAVDFYAMAGLIVLFRVIALLFLMFKARRKQ